MTSIGKTLQSISLLAYLKGVRGVRGPHLVLTPLSTLGNWHREFGRWCPELRVCRFHGSREERAEMIARGDLGMETYDVLLTSYEMAIREKNHINRTQWCFIGQPHTQPTNKQQQQRTHLLSDQSALALIKCTHRYSCLVPLLS